jgi:hypothetical protein
MTLATLHAKPKPNDRHYYAYDVTFDGEQLVTDSRDPEHDLARALLARGHTGVVTLIDGKTGKPRGRINIEEAAKWSVGSNLDKYRWKAGESGNYSPPAGEEAEPHAPQPSDFYLVVVHHGEYLLWQDFLAADDVDVQTRVDEAADRLIAAYIEDRSTEYGWSFDSSFTVLDWGAERPPRYYDLEEQGKGMRPVPSPNFSGRPGDGMGMVRVKVTMSLVETMGLEMECDNRAKIRRKIEELLFAIYSNVADRDIPDPWPTTGVQSMRPLYQPTQTHKADYLRTIGTMGGKDGIKFRQDVWLHPQDHENRKPGAMYDSDGMKDGGRKGPMPRVDGDGFDD